MIDLGTRTTNIFVFAVFTQLEKKREMNCVSEDSNCSHAECDRRKLECKYWEK